MNGFRVIQTRKRFWLLTTDQSLNSGKAMMTFLPEGSLKRMMILNLKRAQRFIRLATKSTFCQIYVNIESRTRMVKQRHFLQKNTISWKKLILVMNLKYLKHKQWETLLSISGTPTPSDFICFTLGSISCTLLACSFTSLKFSHLIMYKINILFWWIWLLETLSH